MNQEVLLDGIEGLKGAYGTVSTAAGAGGQALLRIAEADLPQGCSPQTTPVLVVVPVEGRPQVYVKPGVKLPNGAAPRSTSSVSIEGEEWLQFSYSLPWDEKEHTLVQLVAGSLRRFALKE